MENHSFEYTYSAQQQQEIEDIRRKYLPKEENKMEKLRRLHDSATQKAQAASISAGVLGNYIPLIAILLILWYLLGCVL